MTNQEAFTRVVQHLRKQGERSVVLNHMASKCTAYGACMYRSPNGLRCAVGVLLTDEFYRPEYEGLPVAVKTIQDVLRCALPGVDLQLLYLLQAVHDSTSQWNRREGRWKAIATDWGLVVPPIEVDQTPAYTEELAVSTALSSACV